MSKRNWLILIGVMIASVFLFACHSATEPESCSWGDPIYLGRDDSGLSIYQTPCVTASGDTLTWRRW